MPQSIVKYKIFLASPSDLCEERDSLDYVIKELNQTFGAQQNIIIELLRWETHSAPAITSTYVQNIINNDIGNDYDLFIGLLWKKFGSPTERYKSGTEEEFMNAYNRYLQEQSPLQILFYFKTAAPVSLSEIIPIELEKVQEFRKSLGEKGLLYWEFTTKEELQSFLRIHIPKRILDLQSKQFLPLAIGETEVLKIAFEEDDELGVLDYQELMEESFEYSNEALNRITAATLWIGEEITKKTSELNAIKDGKTEIGKKVVRDFCRRTADIMIDYASRLEPDIPIFINSFEKACQSITASINLYKLHFTGQEEDIYATKQTVENVSNTIEISINSTKGFLDSIASLPRMAKELNKARNVVELRLKELINKLEVSLAISRELIKNL